MTGREFIALLSVMAAVWPLCAVAQPAQAPAVRGSAAAAGTAISTPYLTADMVQAFMDGDFDTYWKLDREFEMASHSLKESLRSTAELINAVKYFTNDVKRC
jgi:hypothetical protein